MCKQWKRVILLVALVACSGTGPDTMKPSEFQCDECLMSIVDMKYKAEALSPKGKRFHFDSIECLHDWSVKHPDQVKSRWVTNYYRSDQWIELSKAKIMRGEKIPSPMSGHLAAVATDEEWKRLATEFEGKRVSWEELSNHGTHD